MKFLCIKTEKKLWYCKHFRQ